MGMVSLATLTDIYITSKYGAVCRGLDRSGEVWWESN
jgi:hypothetical protein